MFDVIKKNFSDDAIIKCKSFKMHFNEKPRM